MLTGQRGGLNREVLDKDGAFQLILAQDLPDFLHQLAVAPAAVLGDVKADDVGNALERFDVGIDGDLRLARELAL